MPELSHSLFGHTPKKVYTPGSISAIQQIVKESPEAAFIPWGGGARQQLGNAPTQYDAAISLNGLCQVVDYQPSDLTITVEAGLTLSAVQSLLAERHQHLPVEVPLPDTATLGGAIATRADSLLRFSRGSVRDALLGVTVVNAKGELIRGGGRVVKNVSGYDLPKLYCGSLGTLGIIVEATLRVVPVVEVQATVLLPLPGGTNSEQALDKLLSSELAPSLLYLVGAKAAESFAQPGLFQPDAQYLVVGFDGSADAVAYQLKLLDAADGELEQDGPGAAIRSALRDFPAHYGDISCSFHTQSSQVGAFLRMLEWTAARSNFASFVAADAAVGMMWAHFNPEEGADYDRFAVELADKAIRCGGSLIVEKMPEQWRRNAMPVWSPILPDIELMKRLKHTLDPTGMWNPGRFIAGI